MIGTSKSHDGFIGNMFTLHCDEGRQLLYDRSCHFGQSDGNSP